jgi:hypothetical protein
VNFETLKGKFRGETLKSKFPGIKASAFHKNKRWDLSPF